MKAESLEFVLDSKGNITVFPTPPRVPAKRMLPELIENIDLSEGEPKED